jgi:putative hemolysin
MTKHAPIFETRLAQSDADHTAARRLRYDVFVTELGADGPDIDHKHRLETDAFDAFSGQLLLLDRMRPPDDQVVGVYRIMDGDAALRAGRFYTEAEFDLTALRATERRLLELGRSCLHPDYRGGTGLMHMWQGLACVVRAKKAEILFGVASFAGTATTALAQPLALLARDHLAPPDLRVTSLSPLSNPAPDDINRVAAMKQVPSLIKAYLRLGGFVGDGAFVDHAFNTTDVCLILDLDRMNPRQRAMYGGGA